MIRIITFISILFCKLSILNAQDNITARLTVLNGTNLVFNFNSLSKIEDGITYNSFTQLRIYFTDTLDNGSPGSVGWELDVKASSDFLMADYGTFNLPLNYIRMYTDYYTVSGHGPFDLSNVDQEIAIWSAPNPVVNVNEIITISYSCGTVPGRKLFGLDSDYFTTDLIFTLKAKD